MIAASTTRQHATPPPTPTPTTPPAQVTSSAKRKLKPGSTQVHQTPDGSFLDLQRNAAELLGSHCGMAVPEVGLSPLRSRLQLPIHKYLLACGEAMQAWCGSAQ